MTRLLPSNTKTMGTVSPLCGTDISFVDGKNAAETPKVDDHGLVCGDFSAS